MEEVDLGLLNTSTLVPPLIHIDEQDASMLKATEELSQRELIEKLMNQIIQNQMILREVQSRQEVVEKKPVVVKRSTSV